MLCAFLCPLLRPHHFVVAGLVCHTCLSVHGFLRKFITVERRVLNRVASQQISARRRQSAASERQSRHDGVRKPSLKATNPKALGSRSLTRSLKRLLMPGRFPSCRSTVQAKVLNSAGGQHLATSCRSQTR